VFPVWLNQTGFQVGGEREKKEEHQQKAHDQVALKKPFGKKLPSGFTRYHFPCKPGVECGTFVER
jgi:hypothetical protein